MMGSKMPLHLSKADRNTSKAVTPTPTSKDMEATARSLPESPEKELLALNAVDIGIKGVAAGVPQTSM